MGSGWTTAHYTLLQPHCMAEQLGRCCCAATTEALCVLPACMIMLWVDSLLWPAPVTMAASAVVHTCDLPVRHVSSLCCWPPSALGLAGLQHVFERRQHLLLEQTRHCGAAEGPCLCATIIPDAATKTCCCDFLQVLSSTAYWWHRYWCTVTRELQHARSKASKQ